MKQKKQMNEVSVFRFKRFARKGYSVFNSLHKVVNIGVLTSSMLTFAHVNSATAQSITTQRTNEMLWEEELEEVVVSASRLETPINRTARFVTVIPKAQIEKAPVQSIQDLLSYAAGIDIIQRGGHGVQADISIRGGSADQTTVLLNGINLSNAQTGHYNFDFPINLSDIERIEVIHGPSALIYGAGSFSGGINIITKKEIDVPLYVSAETGMHQLFKAEVRGAKEIGRTKSSLSVGFQSSAGYIEHSDYQIGNILWQTRKDLGNQSFIDLQAGYNNKRYGANTFYSAVYPNQYERTSAYFGSLKGSFGNTLKWIPMVYWRRHYDQFDLIKNTIIGRNYHRGDMYGTNLIFQYTSKAGTSNLGFELRKEDILSSRLGKPMANVRGKYTHYDDRINTGATFEHTISRKYVVVSAGFLMNHNTLLKGVRFYPSASVAYRPNQSATIHSTWSKSTRLPTFTDLYYTTETHHANEQLQSEYSESVELGFKLNKPDYSLYVVGFWMNGRDIIDWVRESENDKWASWNLTRLHKQGLETGITWRIGNQWSALGAHSMLAIHYARIRQTNDTQGLESRYLLNHLRDKLSIHVEHAIYKGLSAGWYFRFQKRMGVFRKYENSVDMGLRPFPSFSVMDLKLHYALGRLRFHIGLNNLYDTHYYDIGNVPQAGFWMTGGISYR